MDKLGHSAGNSPQRIGLALLAAVSIAVALRAALDVHIARAVFPSWFPTTFLIATVAICAYAVAIAVSLLFGRTHQERPERSTTLALVSAPPIVALCTSGLHGFAPWIAALRPAYVHQFATLSLPMKLNMLLTVVAAVGTILAGTLYVRRRERAAWITYGAVALALFLPNDDCANPFNTWWIATVGASSLMFLPVHFSILVTGSALLGVWRGASVKVLVLLGVGTLVFAFGHILRFIW